MVKHYRIWWRNRQFRIKICLLSGAPEPVPGSVSIHFHQGQAKCESHQAINHIHLKTHSPIHAFFFPFFSQKIGNKEPSSKDGTTTLLKSWSSWWFGEQRIHVSSVQNVSSALKYEIYVSLITELYITANLAVVCLKFLNFNNSELYFSSGSKILTVNNGFAIIQTNRISSTNETKLALKWRSQACLQYR